MSSSAVLANPEYAYSPSSPPPQPQPKAPPSAALLAGENPTGNPAEYDDDYYYAASHFYRPGRFDTTRYFGRAWQVFSSNKWVILRVELLFVLLFAVAFVAALAACGLVEVLLGIEDEAEDRVGSSLDLQAEFHEPVVLFILDSLTDYFLSVAVIYPALMSFFHGVFAMLRRDLSGSMTVSDCFSHYPFSSRRQFPFAVGSWLFAGRVLFSLADFVAVFVLEPAGPVFELMLQTCVWVPYAYYCLFSCLALCVHQEQPDWSPARVLGHSFEIVWDFLGDTFWFIVLSLMLLVAGIISLFVGLLVTLPLVLVAIAFAYDHLEGIKGVAREEAAFINDADNL